MECTDAATENLHLILQVAGEELPEGMCLIALSRSTLPDEFARHVVNQRVLQIDWNALQLTPDETRAIGKLNTEESQTLHHQCEGWVAGLVLLLSHRDVATSWPSSRKLTSKEALFTYFAGEIFARTTSVTRDLLMDTALFPYFSVPMAIELTSNEDAGQILNTIFEKNYFVERKVDGELTYQYHDLFREFLLAKLNETHKSKRAAELSTRAASILEVNSHLSEAVDLFKQGTDWLNVSRLINAHAKLLIATGRWQTVLDWFNGLPVAVVDDDPFLLLWRGEATIPLSLIDARDSLARDSLARAYERFTKQQNDWGHARTVSGMGTLDYAIGRSLTSFDIWYPKIEALIARRNAIFSPRESKGVWNAYSLLIVARIGKGQFVQNAIEWLSSRLESHAINSDNSYDDGMAWLMHFRMWLAEGAHEPHLIGYFERLIQREDIPPFALGGAWRDLGYWYFWNAEYERCLHYYDQGMEIAKRYHQLGLVVVCAVYRAIALSQIGELLHAQDELDQVDVLVSRRGTISEMYVKWARARRGQKK